MVNVNTDNNLFYKYTIYAIYIREDLFMFFFVRKMKNHCSFFYCRYLLFCK